MPGILLLNGRWRGRAGFMLRPVGTDERQATDNRQGQDDDLHCQPVGEFEQLAEEQFGNRESVTDTRFDIGMWMGILRCALWHESSYPAGSEWRTMYFNRYRWRLYSRRALFATQNPFRRGLIRRGITAALLSNFDNESANESTNEVCLHLDSAERLRSYAFRRDAIQSDAHSVLPPDFRV